MDDSPNRRKTVPASYSTKAGPIINLEALKARTEGLRLSPPRRWLNLLPAIIIIFAIAFGGGWLGAWVENHGRTEIATSTAAKQQYISNESQLIESIAKNVGQSVVSIDVTGQDTTAVPDIFGFSFPQTQPTQSAGTGFIISSSGIIVTNRHVVPAGTTSVSVTLSDGTQYNNVQVIGRTSDSSSQDIAFLKIGNLNGHTLVPVALGDSSQVQVGDRVVA
ncbi:MAG TPA: trypsin-like peptidase domain-containing protein, partial [Candidatus Saccharimonadales bacterium]|nr:trypsin-like peptidase domain-containing protein [Candidatus Saccharimonadales bacterium]